MTDFIERIRDVADIETLAGELTQLSGTGPRLVGCCPFHQEDGGSFTVYVDQNSWHCYGCGRHGSVFDLIMESKGVGFWESATTLASRYNIPLPDMSEEEKAEIIKTQEIERLLSLYAAACHRAMERHPEVTEYLHGRGVTDESIRDCQLGVGIKVKPRTDAEKAIMKEAGLLDPRLVGRVIFPVTRNGKVIQISGRTMGDDKPKYLSISRPLFPWNSHLMKRERCILVEGILDAMLLTQAGYPAVSTIHAGMKAEWLRMVGKNTDCYVCYDGDENRTGQTANGKVGEMLYDAGHKVYIVEMPVPHDPASYIQTEGPGAYQVLMDQSLTYIDYLIDSMPETLSQYDLDASMQLLFAKIAKLPSTSHERCINRISERWKLGKVAVRQGLKEHLRQSKKRDDSPDGDAGDSWKIRRRATNPLFFNPGQDVIKGTLYYVIHFEIEGLGAFKPFIITSNKEVFPYNKETLLTRDLICRASGPPSNYSRWSIGTDNPFNAMDYLDGKCHVDPRELYQEIRWFFKHFVRLPDKFYYDFLTCWTMATYHYRLYDSFGYMFLNAMKRSGKTQTLSIINQLAFNACMADALTEAVLKRRVNVDAATIIADEAEYFRHKLADEKSMVFEVFNGGYKRTGRATMVDPDTKAVEDFCTFSPKALANTQGLYDVLADRCITLYLLRSEESVPQFIEADHAGKFQRLRDMLYCFTLECIDGIVETKRTLKHPDNLPGRDWELWHPILNMAAFLDNYKVVDPEVFELADGSSREFGSLYDRMATMAVERREYRKALEEEMQTEPRIMQAIWQYIIDNPDTDEYCHTTELTEYVKEELGLERYSTKALSRFIFDIAKISNRNNPKDKAERHYFDGSGKRKKIKLIRVRKKAVQERARQLFGLVLTESTRDDSPGLTYGNLDGDPFDEE